jgi:F0F1-type ATP synthase assembly protein I
MLVVIMKVEVFDDWKSVVHCIAGGLSYFFIFIFIVFILYQTAEHFIKREDKAYTIGDFMEFSIGFTVVGLLCRLIVWLWW